MEQSVASPKFRGSPFLHPGALAEADSIAVLHLRRDELLPTLLGKDAIGNAGYAEGAVTNTRFGSYPHSTLIGCPWGSQVLASKVDTGSRGRNKASGPGGKKRKAFDDARNGDEDGTERKRSKASHGGETNELNEEADSTDARSQPKKPVAAGTGFCHVLPPTPESWTISLPHRTQVVYTPDYSYILQKIQARPGSVLLEAGAGSGSFTHAAARAVFNGYTRQCPTGSVATDGPRDRRQGKVYSFEYHLPRAEQLGREIEEHGLSAVVQVNHRDVYADGFMVRPDRVDGNHSTDALVSPYATQVFLDLPAPWQALPHLSRSTNGPLDPKRAVNICIFLPCIEQVQRAVTALRTHGWVEISMQELSQRRLEVRRERVGLDLQGLRGVNPSPATVEEAIERLVEVERNGRRYQNAMAGKVERSDASNGGMNGQHETGNKPSRKADRLARIAEEAASRKTFKEGRLVHRTETDIKTHTSYLIFAVLPREWCLADELACQERWPSNQSSMSITVPKSDK